MRRNRLIIHGEAAMVGFPQLPVEHIMKNVVRKSPYAATAAAFVTVLAVGHVLWGWGSLITAFGLLLYCIVAIAITLDAITQRLDGIAKQLDQLLAAALRNGPPKLPAVPDAAASCNDSCDDTDVSNTL
jgi:hypothetical protein